MVHRFKTRVEPHGKTATFFHVPPEVPTRYRLNSGTVVLSAGEFGHLAEQANSDEDLVQLVRAYFA